MSRKVEAMIKDKTTIVLAEDASRGDYIDLANLTNVDLSNIEKQVSDAKEAIYQKKLNEAKKEWQEALAKELKAQENELDAKHQLALQAMQQKLEAAELVAKTKLAEELKEQELNALRAQQKLEQANMALKEQLANADLKAQNAYQAKVIELNEQHQKELDVQRTKYEELNNEYQLLRNQKAAVNNKMIGENLENYCDAQMREALQGGMQNCTWEKDTKAKKEDDEEKGTKADYIFKIYLTPDHLPEELLTSVCLEMKDENPDSKKTKTNEDHYKKLDGDRKKNNAKYAVLVSTLDFKNENLPPIYRVLEYPDMYVVRPGYMLTFLGIIVSLTTRFQDLIISSINSELSLKKQTQFLDEFEALKKTYLDNPLDGLTKKVNGILEQTEKARASINNIDKLCVEITNQYIENIESKLDNFDAKMKTSYRKLNK